MSGEVHVRLCRGLAGSSPQLFNLDNYLVVIRAQLHCQRAVAARSQAAPPPVATDEGAQYAHHADTNLAENPCNGPISYL